MPGMNPRPYDSYKHKKSGKLYTVIITANRYADPDRKKEYPTLIVYRSQEDANIWAQPLDKFLEKMEPA